MLITTLNIDSNPLCVINCYLPSGTTPDALYKFNEDMDALHIVLGKYCNTHEIILIGDLNEDHFHRTGSKEKMMLNLVKEHKLIDLGEESKKTPSYVNPFLDHSSRIDHAFVKPRTGEYTWSQIKVLDEEGNATNTSYHHPVATTLSLQGCRQSRKRCEKQKYGKSWDRKKIRHDIFTKTLDQELCRNTWHELNPDTAINALLGAVDAALLTSCPTRVKGRGRSKQKQWYPELKEAVELSKAKLYAWKSAGKPRGNHPAWEEKKEATRKVRSVQRKKAAADRKALLEEISIATENDPQLAFKLIRQQQKQDNTSTCIKVGESLITDNDEIRSQWASFFENLADADTSWDEELELQVMRRLTARNKDTTPFDGQMLDQAIRSLKPNKTTDLNGHWAELLQLFSPNAKEALLTILNGIVKCSKVPNVLKESYKIVLPKPGKDHKNMDNHRGITIAPVILKLMEKLWNLTGCESVINRQINELQYGFTKDMSPSMASLIITEAIANAKTEKQPLFIISLDARKAFDVVDHGILRKKLLLSGVTGDMWSIIDDLYRNSKERIRWKDAYSRPFEVKRGVKQGSLVSPLLYKLYINNLLDGLSSSELGAKIGSIYIGSPACADDVTLITDDALQVQPLLDFAHGYAQDHRYQLHPQKSSVTSMAKKKEHHEVEWHLGEEEIAVTDSFTHLGVTWKGNRAAVDVNENIKKARRSAYALLRVGLHGVNGVDPPACYKIIQTYVTPRLLHGLDAVMLATKDISLLDKFYKKILRQVQGLPDNVASEAIYLMLGAVPIEAQLHRKVLSLFGNICRLPEHHCLKELAKRQLATQLRNRHSWFKYVDALGEKYDIDIHIALTLPDSKLAWKKRIKAAIFDQAQITLIHQANNRSSLKWLINPKHTTPTVHPLWQVCHGRQHQIAAATVRARMLAGRFKTRELEGVFARKLGKFDTNCRLCNKENEDIAHILVRCPGLNKWRNDKIRTLQNIYIEDGLYPPSSTDELNSAILNGWGYMAVVVNAGSACSSSCSSSVVTVSLKSTGAIQNANSLCNQLCYRMAVERDLAINSLY